MEEGGEKFEGYESRNLDRAKTEEDEIGELGREDNEKMKRKKNENKKYRKR